MGAAVEEAYPGSDMTGLILTPHGHGAGLRFQRLEVLEGGHPVPDAAGAAATERVLTLVRGARQHDLVLVLLSGGGSALLTAPLGVSLDEKAALTRRLLASGADIGSLNVIRKHLSRVKGGRLAVESGAPTLTLALSDVVGDDPATIASGPTVADPSTFGEALELLARYAPDHPRARAALARGAAGLTPESPKPGDPRLERAEFRLVGNASLALEAAARVLEGAGVAVVNLGADLTGEAREVGRQHAQVAATLPGSGPVALLSGGELTVTLTGQHGVGRGGPNAEYALAFAQELSERLEHELRRERASGLARGNEGSSGPRFAVLAADTDGVDGGSGAAGPAGALLGPELPGSDLLGRLGRTEVAAALDGHDSHALLERIGGLFVTGPTGTNVNDLRIVLRL